MESLPVNAVIFGGGAAGLWLLDALTRAGRSALLIETSALGHGQTIASQGILHSGLKYSLQGLLTPAAREAREMPAVWRRHLAGTAYPDLSSVQVLSQDFYLWGTDSAASRLGLFGARLGLHVTPQSVTPANRPTLLRRCTGTVYRVDEQVISTRSLLESLAAPHRERMLLVDRDRVEFESSAPGVVNTIRIAPSAAAMRAGTKCLQLAPEQVIFTAGNGNGALREAVGLDPQRMQRRPLHMLLARGNLPEFYGHCVDGAKTRVSITSGRDRGGRTVWQIGGQIAEDGVACDAATLIRRAQAEVCSVFPDIDLRGTEWSTYRVDRAEGATTTGSRPDSFKLVREGNVLTAWPTKLVLVPQLVAAIVQQTATHRALPVPETDLLRGWPRPAVALPVWDADRTWFSDFVPQRAAA